MKPKLLLTWLVQWRWAPCLALVSGSALFALSAAAFIPEEFGKVSKAEASAMLGGPAAMDVPAGTDQAPSFATRPRTAGRRTAAAAAGPAALGNDSVQSIFHSQPTMELPVAPPDPEPPPPPPPPPLPPPTSTTFTLPEPPPPPPPPPPVDPAPPIASEPAVPNAAAPEAEDDEPNDGAPEAPP